MRLGGGHLLCFASLCFTVQYLSIHGVPEPGFPPFGSIKLCEVVYFGPAYHLTVEAVVAASEHTSRVQKRPNLAMK